jgi:hypothetical protein
MRRMLLLAGIGLVIAFAASGANAIGGGGWTPPWASPYAILEPQTVTPEIVAPQAAEEGRAAFESRDARCKPHDKACLRRMERAKPSDQQ